MLHSCIKIGNLVASVEEYWQLWNRDRKDYSLPIPLHFKNFDPHEPVKI